MDRQLLGALIILAATVIFGAYTFITMYKQAKEERKQKHINKLENQFYKRIALKDSINKGVNFIDDTDIRKYLYINYDYVIK